MGLFQSWGELRDFLARRAPVIFLCLALGAIFGVLVAMRSTPEYHAIASLSVRIDSVSGTTAGRGAENTPARLLQLVEQRLTRRDIMLELANRFDMFQTMSVDERIAAMRVSITLTSHSAVNVGFGSDGALSAVWIEARADTARKARDLANELAAMVITETDAGRLARARETLQFFELEQAQLSDDLAALEEEERAFSLENFGALPHTVELRRMEFGNVLSGIQAAERDISAARVELQNLSDQGISQRRQAQLRDQIAVLHGELERLESQRSELEPYLRQATEVQRDLDRITARQDRLRDQLREVAGQVSTAEAALRLESDPRGNAFEIIDAATLPEHPISRPRRVTAMLGMILGGVVGLVMSLGYELARPALRSVGQVERELDMRPVLVLPELVLPSERRRNRLAWAAGVTLFCIAIAAGMFARSVT